MNKWTGKMDRMMEGNTDRLITLGSPHYDKNLVFIIYCLMIDAKHLNSGFK